MQYSTIVWGNTYETCLNKISRMQNKAIKLTDGGKWCESATLHYSELQILKLADLYRLELASFMLKFKTDLLPNSFLNYYK